MEVRDFGGISYSVLEIHKAGCSCACACEGKGEATTGHGAFSGGAANHN